MKHNSSKQIIENIVNSTSSCSNETQENIKQLIDTYEKLEQDHAQLETQNQFFLKKWDKMNILMSEHNAQKDKLLEKHSRQAAMGEMIDAVAHQWKQPLNAISMIVDMLKYDFEEGSIDKEYIEEIQKDVHLQIDYMVTTLKEFRNFLRPSTEDEFFNLKNTITTVELLLKDELISQHVNLVINIDSEINILGNKNEFNHVAINIINNAIDVFNERDIVNRTIDIRAYTENDYIYIEIEDNAGGVPKEILKEIFQPNFTTKAEGKGTGIGLYMSKQIVQKYNGSINVHNSGKGAFFTIKLSQETK